MQYVDTVYDQNSSSRSCTFTGCLRLLFSHSCREYLRHLLHNVSVLHLLIYSIHLRLKRWTDCYPSFTLNCGRSSLYFYFPFTLYPTFFYCSEIVSRGPDGWPLALENGQSPSAHGIPYTMPTQKKNSLQQK